MSVLTALKDALLCLLIATTLTNMCRKNAYASIGALIVFFCMGLDL